MKKFFLIALIFLFSNNLISQNLVEEFKFNVENKNLASNYSKITVIDSRLDTTNVGVIQKGAFNRKAYLKTKESLKVEINNAFKKLLGTDVKDNELVLNIRDFKFTELTEAMTETGYCYIRADLFAKKDDQYFKIDFIDEVKTVEALDVTKKNIKNGSETFIKFLQKNLMTTPKGELFTLDEIINIVNLEKSKIPVYNTVSYVDGIYQDYESFKNQTPNSTQYLITKNKSDRIVKLESFIKDKPFQVDINYIYCIVDKGNIYFINNGFFVPVQFKDNDFYFKGIAKKSIRTGDVILPSVFFGVLGVVMMPNPYAQFLMKIDHLNGATIQVKELN